MSYSIAPQQVKDSIDYFKSLPIPSEDFLFLYLLTKSLGITQSSTVNVTNSQSSERKDLRDQIMWQLGGISDPREKPGKNSVIFPNCFKDFQFYQPGTVAKSVGGRIQDTIKQKIAPLPIFNHKNYNYKLSRNYKELIIDHFLSSDGDEYKISLGHLATWINRFSEFDFTTRPSHYEFRKVIISSTKKLLKISQSDFLWLFEDDIHKFTFDPSETPITGAELREHIGFPDDKEPEVVQNSQGEIFKLAENFIVASEETQNLIKLSNDNPLPEEINQVLLSRKQVILYGVPGVGKSHFSNSIAEKFDCYEIVQFHPSYSYDDFISSQTLTAENGASKVVPKIGKFLEFVKKAESDKNSKHLFIIDEINRGNVSEIFGETILALDRNYSVELSRPVEEISKLKIPENLYILGTMNTSDRNIAFLDLALRRRFSFIPLKPDYDFLDEQVCLEDYLEIDFGSILRDINSRIMKYLNSENFLLGHSYLIPDDINQDIQYDEKPFVWTAEDLMNRFNYGILPTLREYAFDDPNLVSSIIGDVLSDAPRDVEEFMTAFKMEFDLED